MKFGIVVFPGSNCDHDAYHAVKEVLGEPAELLWHKDRDLKGADVVVLPGGFSYGDYLRCGAIARFSPVMDEVIPFARGGGKVLGICNGFQVLTEAGLLPGEHIRIPVAHGDGNYFIDEEGLKRLEGEGRVALRYLENPNGALRDIAGIVNEAGNVMGLMPHPERASEKLLGSADGLRLFQSLLG